MAKRKQTVREKYIKRIERYFKTKEKEGFRWSEEFKKSIYILSLPKLKKLTPEMRLRKAQAISPITGKVVSGTQAQSERISLKRKETRKKKERTDRDAEPAPAYESEVILDRLYQLADSVPGVGGEVLRRLLDSEVSKFGRARVAQALSSAPEEAVVLATDLVYYENRDSMLRAYVALQNLIRGTIPTKEEAEETGNILDTLTDFGEYED